MVLELLIVFMGKTTTFKLLTKKLVSKFKIVFFFHQILNFNLPKNTSLQSPFCWIVVINWF